MSIRPSGDHDLTVFPTGPAVPAPQASGVSALEPGTSVHEFRILRLIGEGGFGIVYLAEDQSLDRTVALKEYMPSELAERAGGTSGVQVRSQRYAETFEAGMRSFINEARLLARFDHPSLLKVYRFFQANGTAYMAMPFYEGQTLKTILRDRTEPPDERWLRRILYQLLDALEIIHRHECYHRDIAPDNVLMIQNDTPILLDFGAARRVIGDMTQNLTVILKPGYAPIEQYAEDPDMKQGPWTDIYALASVVHFALTRKPPPASIARAMTDRMEPLAQRLRGAYSHGFLSTIDKALSLKPQDRPQSIAALRTMLLASDDGTADEELPPPPLLGIEPLAPAADRGGRTEPSTQHRLATGPRSVSPAPDEATGPAARPDFAAGEPRGRLGIVGLAVAVPAALGFLWWLTSGSGEPPPAPSSEAPPPPKSAAAPPPARVEPPPPAATRPEPAPPPRVATPAPPPSAPPPAAAVAPKPVPTPAKIAEAPLPKAQPQAPPPLPPVAAKKAPEPPPPVIARKAAEPSAKSEPVVETRPPAAPPRVETPRLQRSEEVAEAPKSPPQQLARVEPKPEPAPPPPPAKAEPAKAAPPAKGEAPKPPVEVARVEPPAPRTAAAAAEKALIGRYTGKMETGGWAVVVTLDISSVQDGTVVATANHSAGPCQGSYRMTGTVRDDSLRMRSTHAGGKGGDCSFGFRGSVQGTKLVGTTGNGVPLEFTR